MTEQQRTEQRFRGRGWRVGNALVSAMAKLGVGPIHLLTTRGRRSGRPSTVPVVPVEEGGKRWLVAPYGPVDWVHNARTTARVRLRYGTTTQELTVREAVGAEAAPILWRYVTVATTARSQFDAAPEDPPEAFEAEVDGHPVFELIATND